MAKLEQTSPAGTRSGGRPKWPKRLGLILAGVLVGLLAAELILRVLLPTARDPYLINAFLDDERGKFCQYDAELGWTGRPNIEDQFVAFDCENHVQQNHHGFRGTAYPFDRTTAGRLLVLGDSYTWGYGVDEEQIFTTILQRQADPRLEVVNLGVSGYGTDQELLLYRKLGRKFQADQVLLAVTPYTDLMDNQFAVRYGHPKPLFKQPEDKRPGPLELTNVPVPQMADWSDKPQQMDTDRHWLCQLATRSSLAASILNATSTNPSAREWLEQRRIRIPRNISHDWAISCHTSELPLPWEQAFELLTRLIQQFHTEVAANGVELSILLVPSVIDVDPVLWDEFQQQNHRPYGQQWDRDHVRRRLKDFCKSSGIQLVDPTDALRSAAEHNSYLYYPWNQHWTPAGHQIVAELLQEELANSPDDPNRVDQE